MKPTIGRIVHFKHVVSDEPLAAIVCRVMEDAVPGAIASVNLTVFWSGGGSGPYGYVPFYESEAAAKDASASGSFCYWPPMQTWRELPKAPE